MNPFKIPAPALIAVSGGRTSAYMLRRVLDAYDGTLPQGVVAAFCNTGLEHNLTLDFVHECETRWGVHIHWLEFDRTAENLTRIVDYQTASRDGRPMREIIATRPTAHLFNPVSRYCSVTAKARRMQKLMHKVYGFDWWHATIGLRADEPGRVERARARDGIDRQRNCLPLADAGITKEMIADYWRSSAFDLQLPNVGGVTPMGNCVMCPMKARAKLINGLRVMPEAADWWIGAEDEMTVRIADIPQRKGRDVVVGYDEDGAPIKEWDAEYVPPDRRNRFHKDGTSYRDLLAKAQSLNEQGAPLDDGFDIGIDCMCTD